MSSASDFNLQRVNTKELYDNLLATIEYGGNVFVAGQRGIGKMLSLDTDVPTPTGFTKLRDLKEQDEIFDENGDICRVLKLHPIDEKPISYRITFDDGNTVDACKDHLWLTWTKSARLRFCPNLASYKKKRFPSDPAIRTTQQIFNTLTVCGKKRETNHSIPCSKPVRYPEKDLPIDPYVLGIWLGDGTTNSGIVESADNEILDNLISAGYNLRQYKPGAGKYKSKSRSYRVGDLVPVSEGGCGRGTGQLKMALSQQKLLGHKHIPNEYLYASYEQRLSLLQGLLDSDGFCSKGEPEKAGKRGDNKGRIEFCTVLPELGEQVLQLIRSLGIKANIHKSESWLYDIQHKDRYRISFTTQLPVFRLSRKLDSIRIDKNHLTRTTHRYITNVEPIEPVPMRCITVDSPNGLFLITKSFIPTHNTHIAKQAIEKSHKREVYLNASVFDRCDLAGFPRLTSDQKDEFIRFLLPDYYRYLIDGKEQCVVLFDEIDKSDASILAPLLEFIQLHSVNGRPLNNLAAVIMTGNLIAEGGQRPSLPLLDRAEGFVVESSLRHFLEWGATSGEIHPSVAAYLNDHPDDLMGDVDIGDNYKSASPRGWHNYSKVMRFGEERKWNREMLKAKAGAILGKKVGIQYASYFDHYIVLLPYIERIMSGDIPRDFGSLNPTKQIVACMAVCARAANEIDQLGKNGTYNALNTIGRFLQTVDPEMAFISLRSQINLKRLISVSFEKYPDFDAVLEILRKRLYVDK